MKYSCCIEMLFTEYPFAQRIYKSKEAGFDCVEFWCWENKDLQAVRKALDETGLEVAIMQGNIDGRMVDPADFELYVTGVKRSVETAKFLGVKNLFLMSDVMKEDRSVLDTPYPLTLEQKKAATLAVLRALIPVAEENDICFVIEPLNTLVDHKGYSLCHSVPGAEIIREVGHPRIGLLYDAYHMQIMEGNIIQAIQTLHETFGYFHIADVPGRCEPGTGELNYYNIIRALKATGYDQYIGFEFEARDDSAAAITKRLVQEYRTI